MHMKVLIVSQYYYPENFVISKIAEKLVSFGHSVDVLTAKPNYGFGKILDEYVNVREERINDVNVHRVNIKPRGNNRLSIIFNYLSFWKNSRKWVRKTKEKYDIILTMGLSPVTILSAGNLYKKIHNVPHIVHCVDLWPESVLATHSVRKNSLMYRVLYKWSRALYSKADKVLVGSPSFEEYFKTVLKLDMKLDFVPQPSLIEDSNDIRPIDFDGGFNIVYCGNIGILQEAEKIPEIMKNVKNDNVNFHIIGMGPKSDDLVENIAKYGQIRRVFYHGPMKASDASCFIKGADALYLSLNDAGYAGKTIPNKMMMYLSFGKPIIGVVGGDAKDVLEANSCGFTAENNADNVAEIIDKISCLSKEELLEIGNKNKTLYEKEFSQDKISRKIEKELLSNI